jgi:hypothetical protein
MKTARQTIYELVVASLERTEHSLTKEVVQKMSKGIPFQPDFRIFCSDRYQIVNKLQDDKQVARW